MSDKGQIIHGIQLSTYLQMLVSEKKSCMLHVREGQNVGILCMEDGILLNAQTKRIAQSKDGARETCEKFREEAVVEMLGWSNPVIQLSRLTKKFKRQIVKSLEYLILNSCRVADEIRAGDALEALQPTEKQGLGRLLGQKDHVADVLKRTPEIYAYLVMDMRGNILLKHEGSGAIDPDFISFVHFVLSTCDPVIMSHIKPKYMYFTLDSGHNLLCLSNGDTMFGLDISTQADIDAVRALVSPLFSHLRAVAPRQ